MNQIVVTLTKEEADDLKAFLRWNLAEWATLSGMTGGCIDGFSPAEVKRVMKTIARIEAVL